MSRFETVTGVDIIYEAVAPRIDIHWNPETGAGSVSFWVEQQEFRKPPDLPMEFVARKADTNFYMRPMGRTIDHIINDTITVPLPDGTTTDLSGGFLMLAIKAAFDKYYSEELAARAAPPPDELPDPPDTVPQPIEPQ